MGRARSDWEEIIEKELSENLKSWWLYPEIWGLRRMILGNLTDEELLSQLRVLETHEKGAELLRTLAFGYWYAGEPEKAFDQMSELCDRFPGSPYTVSALNRADLQVFSKNLDHLRPRVDALIVTLINKAPKNPGLKQEPNALAWIWRLPGVDLDAVRTLHEAWTGQDPTDPHPYYLLADALLKEKTSYEEAEELINKALDLFYQQRAFDSRKYLLCLAFRVRAHLRLRRDALPDALADLRMAREYSIARWTKDLETEAGIWRDIGHFDKAEATLLEAYRQGSLTAERLFQETYAARTGKKEGFQEYFMRRLTSDESKNPSAEERGLELAPSIDAKTLDAVAVTSSSLKGQPVVANFWFIACGPCIGEIPRLNELVDKFAGKVRFLAFARDEEKPLRQFLQKKQFKYEVVPSSSALEESFGVERHPTHYIIDRDGYIVWRAHGANPENIQTLEAMLERLLAGRL